jgi:hypothetical protein
LAAVDSVEKTGKVVRGGEIGGKHILSL